MIPPLFFIPQLDKLLGINFIVQCFIHMVVQISHAVNWLLWFVISTIDLVLKIISLVFYFVYFIISIPYWIDQQINWLFHPIVQIFVYAVHTSWAILSWIIVSSPSLVTTAGRFVQQQLNLLGNWILFTAQDLGQFWWDVLLLILYRMWFILQLVFYAIAFATVWYIGTLVYHFLTCHEFALQGEFYFGPHPQHENQPQGVLTIAPMMIQGGRGRARPPQLMGYIQ